MPSICLINMVRQNCNSVILTNNVLTVCCTEEVLCLPFAVLTWLDKIGIVFA